MTSATNCTRCGLELRPGKAFCGNCGLQVREASPVPAPWPDPSAATPPVSPYGDAAAAAWAPIDRPRRRGRWIALGAILGLLFGAGTWVGLSGRLGSDSPDDAPIAVVHPGYDSSGLTSGPGVVATGFLDGDPTEVLLNFWDSDDGSLLGQLKRNPDDATVAAATAARPVLSPDGETVAVVVRGAAADQSRAGLWDVASGDHLRWLDPEPDLQTDPPVFSLAFSPDGQSVAGLASGHFYQWDVESGDRVGEFELEGLDAPANLTYSPDGTRIGVAGDSIWILPAAGDGALELAKDSAEPFPMIAFRPGRDDVLANHRTEGTSSQFRIWDQQSGDELRQISDGERHATAAAYSPDGQLLATAFVSGDGTVLRFTELATGETLGTFELTDRVAELEFNVEGTALFIGGGDLSVLRLTDADIPAQATENTGDPVLPGQAPSGSATTSPTPSSSCLPFNGPPEEDSTEHPYLTTAMSGTCREDVKQLQDALGLEPDGFFDQRTADAVLARQAQYTACITVKGGQVGPQTWSLIVEEEEPCAAARGSSTSACSEEALRAASDSSGRRPMEDENVSNYFKVERCTAEWALVLSGLSGASWEGWYLLQRDGASWTIVRYSAVRAADNPTGVYDCDSLEADGYDVEEAQAAVGDRVGPWAFCA